MIRTITLLISIVISISSFAQIDPDSVYIEAEQELKEGGFTNTLGGSAPARIYFYAHPDETNLFYTWRIYDKTNLESPIVKYTDRDINYTFEKAGYYVVKLEVADLESETTVDAVPIEFEIWLSELDIPNFFSPGDSPGINDEFRVKYKSIVKFKCTIFNRWGVKLYQWNDPDKGWDGTYKGKRVNPGVYFYVIEATGSEGKKYKEMGDINILR